MNLFSNRKWISMKSNANKNKQSNEVAQESQFKLQWESFMIEEQEQKERWIKVRLINIYLANIS